MTLKVETLRWRDGALELIDQRRLPLALEYVRCRCAADTAEAIRDMVVRGAPAIGCAAAYGLAVEALRLRAPRADGILRADGPALRRCSRRVARPR